MRAALIVLGVWAAACVPTAARKDARIEPGFDLDLIAGGQLVLEGVDENGDETETAEIAHLEVDVQIGDVFASGAGAAVQLKVPTAAFLTSLDLYYQLAPLDARTYAGVGVELGIVPGVYGTYTRLIGRGSFLTFTGRVLSTGDGNVMLNPQLAMGLSGAADLTVFAAFAQDTGRGIDVAIRFGDSDDHDYRKRFGLVGVSLRF